MIYYAPVLRDKIQTVKTSGWILMSGQDIKLVLQTNKITLKHTNTAWIQHILHLKMHCQIIKAWMNDRWTNESKPKKLKVKFKKILKQI